MMEIYNWFVCKFFKRSITHESTEQRFKRYCELNPWASECKIYED
jgi:hypothetical protein